MGLINNYLHRKFIGFLFALPFFIIFGFMNLSFEIFPTVVEIKHLENKTQATIGHKFIFSNSLKHSLLISNVKEAKMIKGLNASAKEAFKIVLVDKDGELYSVTSYFSSSKDESKQLLLKRLNTAIKSDVDFTFEIINKKSMVLSIICIVIPSLILYFWISYKLKESKKEARVLKQRPAQKTEEEIYLENNPISEAELERQALEAENPVEEPKESDGEKYKNINDSIIK